MATKNKGVGNSFFHYHRNTAHIFRQKKAKVTTKSYAIWLKIPFISFIQHLSQSGGHLGQSATAAGNAILDHISLSQPQSLRIPLTEMVDINQTKNENT